EGGNADEQRGAGAPRRGHVAASLRRPSGSRPGVPSRARPGAPRPGMSRSPGQRSPRPRPGMARPGLPTDPRRLTGPRHAWQGSSERLRRALRRTSHVRRLNVTLMAVAVAIAVVLVRLVQLQGAEASHFRYVGHHYRVTTQTTPAVRGDIVSSDGAIL